jgi:AcrR family transcriptional regulator
MYRARGVAPTADKRKDAQRRGKDGQRRRIVDAMIELCAREGYGSVSIADVSTRGGVSVSTFYELFGDKEACLLAAYEEAVRRLLEPLPLAPHDDGWLAVLRSVLAAVMEGFAHDPDAGRVMLVEARAAGPLLRDGRVSANRALGERLEAVLDHPSSDERTLDIPATALVGGLRAVLSSYLRASREDELPALTDDALAWVGSYAVPDDRKRWSTGRGALLPMASVRRPRALAAPAPLPRGRHSLPAALVTRSQRTRIIHATADVMLVKGYADATVADIVAAARVARDVFYEHFANKHDAFLAAQQHSTQDILDACAIAYFSATEWPERVWRGLRTLLDVIVQNPALAHLRLVECYAAGSAAVARAEEITRSFTVFLEEGYRYGAGGAAMPRLCSTAITGAIFDLIQRYIADGHTRELPRTLPLLTYIAVAPFTGPADAVRWVGELGAREAASARKAPRARARAG